MAAIRNKNYFNVYGREEHKKSSLVSINNLQLPKAQRLKNRAYCSQLSVFHFWYFCLNMNVIVSRGTGLDNWGWICSSGIFRSYLDVSVITITSFCSNAFFYPLENYEMTQKLSNICPPQMCTTSIFRCFIPVVFYLQLNRGSFESKYKDLKLFSLFKLTTCFCVFTGPSSGHKIYN